MQNTPAAKTPPTLNLVLSDKDFDFIRNLVYRSAGIHLKDSKRALVTNRLRKRLIALGLGSFDQYCSLLRKPGALDAELPEILDSITTNETYFFREGKHFDFLNKIVFPECCEKRAKLLTVWCAGCSTGQEPYTIAIAALEHMAAAKSRFSISILATDICAPALAEAREGLFPERKMRGVTPGIALRYFDKSPEGFALKKEARNLVRFQRLNIVSEKPQSKFDVIFCRNVMIYFDMESQARAVANLHSCLNKDGILLIGHAESLYRHSVGFETLRIADTIVYKKEKEKSGAVAGEKH